MSFADAGRKIVEGTAAGLYQAGTIVIAESEVLVPVEYGTLKRSARVEDPVVEGDSVSVTVGYGYGSEYAERVSAEDPDDTTGYAIYVHEIARYKHAPPTQYKYLELPARAFEPELGPVVAASIKAKLAE